MLVLQLTLPGFFLAALMPLLHKKLPSVAAYLAALFPLAVFLYLLSFLGNIEAFDPQSDQLVWVKALNLNITGSLDALRLLFALTIAGIGFLVYIYAAGYFKGKSGSGRFFMFLLMFTAAMFGVVLSGNLLVAFVFWELTSFTSYFLISFNHENEDSRRNSLQALLITAGGGLALLAGITLIGLSAGSFEYNELIAQREQLLETPGISVAAILILVGAFSKSAQFPFHFWLPGAMAAPTPVSAYLHSATMVKLGVFLIAALMPVLGTHFQEYCLYLGGITMVWGAVNAPFFNDLKRMLAYSTLSVLGMLIWLLGIGSEKAVKAAVVVFIAHALYKSTLFLIAGSIDKATGTRNILKLSGLGKDMPLFALAGALAAASMAGVIPFLGFVAKEAFLEAGLVLEPIWIPFLSLSGIGLAATAWLAGVRPFLGKAGQVKVKTLPFVMWVAPLTTATAGLFFGIFVKNVDKVIASQAAETILMGAGQVKTVLWHGFTPILAWSVGLLILAILVLKVRDQLQTWCESSLYPRLIDPPTLFQKSLNGTLKFAETFTQHMQSPSLSRNLRVILLAFLGLGLLTLTQYGFGISLPSMNEGSLFEFGLGLIILAGAIIAMRSNSLLSAAAAIGVTGFAVSGVFLFYGAPDLAITQLVIETLTVLLFVLVVHKLPAFSQIESKGRKLRDLLLSLAAGLFITILVWKAGSLQIEAPISSFFMEHAYSEAHGRNVVNVILVDFRAMDTLGEITVLLVAAAGVATLTQAKRKRKET